MKKLLILGASQLQLPMIKKAKEKGCEVSVADINSNAVGIKFSDNYFKVSTTDYEGLKKVVERLQPDGIITMATDMPIPIIARLNQDLGLKGINYDTSIRATNKYEMMRTFKERNIPTARTLLIESKTDILKQLDKIIFPCIIKPVDSAGSRGVFKVKTSNELFDKYDKSIVHSPSKKVIIQEFLEGEEISVEALVVDNQIHIIAITDKTTTGSPFFVEVSHQQPAKLTAVEQSGIKELAKKAIEAIGINHGPVHVEIMRTEKKDYIIELGARLGGDFITSHLVPYSTGIDLVSLTIDYFLGEKIKIQKKIDKSARVDFIFTKPGVLKSIGNIDKIKNIKGVDEIIFFKDVGSNIGPIESSNDRLGAIITSANTFNELKKCCDNVKALLSIEVE